MKGLIAKAKKYVPRDNVSKSFSEEDMKLALMWLKGKIMKIKITADGGNA